MALSQGFARQPADRTAVKTLLRPLFAGLFEEG
jgi:hypothetical protein